MTGLSDNAASSHTAKGFAGGSSVSKFASILLSRSTSIALLVVVLIVITPGGVR